LTFVQSIVVRVSFESFRGRIAPDQCGQQQYRRKPAKLIQRQK
jgi:hypothetical protein